MILFDQGKLVMPLLQLELLFTICDATAFPKLRDALRDVTPSPPINHKVVVRLVVVVFVYVLGGGGGGGNRLVALAYTPPGGRMASTMDGMCSSMRYGE